MVPIKQTEIEEREIGVEKTRDGQNSKNQSDRPSWHSKRSHGFQHPIKKSSRTSKFVTDSGLIIFMINTNGSKTP